MTDTLTVGRITHPPIERNEFTFVVPPDPRDKRIAELEQWTQVLAGSGEGIARLCHSYKQQAEVAQARIAELEQQYRGLNILFSAMGDLRSESLTRIAELEAALREIESEALRSTGTKWGKLAIIQDIASGALMPSPEGDMAITKEVMDA